jgi:hypothetical protein
VHRAPKRVALPRANVRRGTWTTEKDQGDAMPKCKYCGQPAGFFHWQHAECNEKHENGKRQLAIAITAAASGDSALDSLDAQLDAIAARSYISKGEERSLVIQAWTAADAAATGVPIVAEARRPTPGSAGRGNRRSGHCLLRLL